MSKAKKLTEAQQTVVNLMAKHGDTLRRRHGYGSAHAHFLNNPDIMRLRADVPEQLEAKGVVRMTSSTWQHREYALTPLGKSLVKSLPKSKPQVVTWFYVTYGDIDEVQFVRVNDKCCYTAKGQQYKRSDIRLFEHRSDAVNYVRRNLAQRIEYTREKLASAEQALADFNAKEAAAAAGEGT